MATVTKPTDSPQTTDTDARTARQAAFLAILIMFLAVVLLNIASYSLAAIAARFDTSPIHFSDSQNFPSTLTDERLNWGIAFNYAPAATKACFSANFLIASASCFALMHAFFFWVTKLALVSSTVRNYALAYGVGGLISGLIFIHVVLVSRLKDGEGFFVMMNSIAGPTLAGLVFGTLEV